MLALVNALVLASAIGSDPVPVAMVVRLQGAVELEPYGGKVRRPEIMDLLYIGDAVSAGDDDEILFVFLADKHAERLKPGCRAVVDRGGCTPMQAVEQAARRVRTSWNAGALDLVASTVSWSRSIRMAGPCAWGMTPWRRVASPRPGRPSCVCCPNSNSFHKLRSFGAPCLGRINNLGLRENTVGSCLVSIHALRRVVLPSQPQCGQSPGKAVGLPQELGPVGEAEMTALASRENLAAVGPYELLAPIIQGTVTTIFKGRHHATGQLVAVKLARPPYSRDKVLVSRFEQEYRASSSLVHSNLVRSIDFGQDDSAVYLVFEFVVGTSLAESLAQGAALPEAEAVRILVQAAQGLHHAHKHGIIHRDVKPDNIFLPMKGQAKLADLGLMKDLEMDLGLTRPNESIGTPCFMAPEQMRDAKHAGVRCDVYSLGATLYMAVTGQLPFHARGLPTILRKKLANDLTPPRTLVRALSEGVERAILRAVRADPDVRQRNCLEFIESLTTDKMVAKTTLAAKRSKTQPACVPEVERRASVRYACDVNLASRRKISIHPDDEQEDTWEATVRDLSVKGIGLVVSRRFEIGAILAVELGTNNASGRQAVEMRVARVERASHKSWFVGGTFTQKLSKEELRKLL
jgi:serine/threonine protein kinase